MSERRGLALQPGDVLSGRYRLKRILGTGAMGAIWEARNEATERDFAIKLLHPVIARDPLMVQRFLQEAKAAGSLRHRSIIEVYDMGQIEPARAGGEVVPYMVMELLDGESLEERVQRENTLPLATALAVARACAEALGAAHAGGIIHRDLKPANVFLHRTDDGTIVPKLLDFGISKLTDPERDAGLTRSGMVMGSPSFMSPEQCRADAALDARSDIWSLGIILYRCLAGRLPFRSERLELIVNEIAHTEPVPLEQIASVPPAVAAIVRRCLEKDKERRFESAVALAEALRSAEAQSSSGGGIISRIISSSDLGAAVPSAPSVPDLPSERPRRLARWIVAAAVFVTTTVVALALVSRARGTNDAPPPPPSVILTPPPAVSATEVTPVSAIVPGPALPSPSPPTATVHSAAPRTAPTPRVVPRAAHSTPSAAPTATDPVRRPGF
jgi:serine/threonine-protein kinase